jgi:hypothetical protein
MVFYCHMNKNLKRKAIAFFFPMESSTITCCNADGLVKLYVTINDVKNIKILRQVLIYYSKTGCDKN